MRGPMDPDDHVPWDAYARSIVRIEWADGARIRLEPRPSGTTEGAFPEDVGAIHVITAHNPASRALPAADNARRNADLEAAMRRVGWAWRPAVGASAEADEPWEEASFAVLDEDLSAVLEMARRFGQAAIYEWTRRARVVVPTAADADPFEHGWRAIWR